MNMAFVYGEKGFRDSKSLVAVDILKGLVLNVFIQSVPFKKEIAGKMCNILKNNTAIMICNIIYITRKIYQ